MSNLDSQLAKLNPNGYAKRDAELIREWKERVPKLVAQVDFLNHPITEELRQEIVKRIQAIDAELSNNFRLTTDERLGLFGEKRAHQFYLDFLSQDPEGELKTIERAVDLETQGD